MRTKSEMQSFLSAIIFLLILVGRGEESTPTAGGGSTYRCAHCRQGEMKKTGSGDSHTGREKAVRETEDIQKLSARTP